MIFPWYSQYIPVYPSICWWYPPFIDHFLNRKPWVFHIYGNVYPRKRLFSNHWTIFPIQRPFRSDFPMIFPGYPPFIVVFPCIFHPFSQDFSKKCGARLWSPRRARRIWCGCGEKRRWAANNDGIVMGKTYYKWEDLVGKSWEHRGKIICKYRKKPTIIWRISKQKTDGKLRSK